MYKRNFLYLFVCLILFFINTNTVNADDQLVCIYSGKTGPFGNNILTPALMYVKDTNGFSYIYFNYEEKSPKFESANWTYCSTCLTGNRIDFSNTKYYDDNTKSLTGCPSYVYTDSDGINIFYDKNKGRALLDSPSVDSDATVNVTNPETVESKAPSANTFSLVEGKSCAEIDFNDLWIDDPGDEWDQACLYAADFEGTSGDKFTGCIIYQLSYDDSSFETFGVFSGDGRSVFNTVILDSTLDLYRKVNNACPPNLRYTAEKSLLNDHGNSTYSDGFNFIVRTNGNSTSLLIKKRELVASDYSPLVINNNFEIEDCGDLLSDDMVELISTIITYTKILLPILLIVLGIIDFVTALFSSKEEDMKKNAKKFLTRVIICMVIFLIPSLLQAILKIASLIWTDIDSSLCGIL